MKEIELTRGRVAQVDDEDYDALIKFSWRADEVRPGYWYAVTGTKRVYMHRLLLRAPKGKQVDHKDHDGLNNQRSNIRLCTDAQNQGNRRLDKDNTSGYKGVHWHPSNKKWIAVIGKGPQKHIGSYDSPEEAARAYDKAALKRWGEFAKLNFGPNGEKGNARS